MTEGGCLGEPKGSVRTQPLQPQVRRAVSEALADAGLDVVPSDAEPDMVAGVEWRGTDTIALGLRDVHGHLLHQSSYSRSLAPCRALAELTYDSCWVANFERMKQELSRPLERSPALLAFARKTKGVVGDQARSTAPAAVIAPRSDAPLSERLSDQQLQETVARYREPLQRSCWLPALEARDESAPSSARVSTSVTVAASGGVLDIKTGGDPLGYPRLAECIASQVRTWHFPAAKNATTASIPFVFAGN